MSSTTKFIAIMATVMGVGGATFVGLFQWATRADTVGELTELQAEIDRGQNSWTLEEIVDPFDDSVTYKAAVSSPESNVLALLCSHEQGRVGFNIPGAYARAGTNHLRYRFDNLEPVYFEADGMEDRFISYDEVLYRSLIGGKHQRLRIEEQGKVIDFNLPTVDVFTLAGQSACL